MLCHGDLSSAQLFLSLLFPSLIVLVSLDSGAHFLQLRVVVARVMEAHAPGSLLVLRVFSEPVSLTFSPFLLSVIVLVSLDSGAHFLQLRVVVARVLEAHAPGSLLVVCVSSEPVSLTFSPFLLSVFVLVSLDDSDRGSKGNVTPLAFREF